MDFAHGNKAKRRRIALGLAALAAAATGWHFLNASPADQKSGHGGGKNAPVPVAVAAAKTGDMPITLEGLGNITPRSNVTVHTQVNGQLMSVLFTEGQMVKKDDHLAKIDDRPFIAQLEQAQGALKRDQALLAQARLDLERYRILWSKDSIAKQQYDAQASLVKQDEGAVLADQGQVDNAKTNLAYTDITAPVNGRVGLRQVDAGNIVHTTDTNGIAVVTELQPITALFTVPEDNIQMVSKHADAGERLAAEAWDRANTHKLADGVLTAIDNQVDPATGTVKFRAEFPNEDNALFPSQFVNIRLQLDTLKNAVLIPAAAVQHGSKGSFVYRVNPDSTVSVQNVTLGPAQGESVSVTEGIKEGDRMVVDGIDNLRDGAKIEIADAKAAPASDEKALPAESKPEGGRAEDQDAPYKHHKKSDSSGATANP